MGPTNPGFDSASAAEFRDMLLRTILRRYACGDLRSSAYPARGSAADAADAAERRDGGRLLKTACDVWGIPFGELASRSRVGQTVISSFVMGSAPLSWEDTKALSNAVHDSVREKSGQPVRPDL